MRASSASDTAAAGALSRRPKPAAAVPAATADPTRNSRARVISVAGSIASMVASGRRLAGAGQRRLELVWGLAVVPPQVSERVPALPPSGRLPACGLHARVQPLDLRAELRIARLGVVHEQPLEDLRRADRDPAPAHGRVGHSAA